MQSFKTIGTKLSEELRSQEIPTAYIIRVKIVKNDEVHNVEKVTKIDLIIMSNTHAHFHTMRKTHAKFQNNGCKTVRGVALTRDTLCLYNQGEK